MRLFSFSGAALGASVMLLGACESLGIEGATANQAQVNLDPAAPGYAYRKAGVDDLNRRLAYEPNNNRAKNLIIFVGDGVSPTFLTAARIYEGQQRGEDGEENYLAFERFPHSALIKTYSADGQIPDSAATASALMTGVKTDNGKIGVYAGAGDDHCAASTDVPANMNEAAQTAGKSVGVVTTSYILDATPSAVFAHAPSRGWIVPQRVSQEAKDKGCEDLALQLKNSGVSLAMGGGRRVFLSADDADPEGGDGVRADGRNIIAEWTGEGGDYVWNADQLSGLDMASGNRVLGLFSSAAMYEEEDAAGNPSLAEMTGAAIEILSKNDDGFVLLIEDEGTDEFQHAGHVRRVLESAVELNEAVKTALEMVDLDETLIVVTADHGQGIAFSGYAKKGNPILGLATTSDGALHMAADGKPYTTLGFHTAPQKSPGARREDLTDVDTTSPDFIPQSAVPAPAVYHSGDDVALYATGPRAHLFSGLIDQSTVFYLMGHALGFNAGE